MTRAKFVCWAALLLPSAAFADVFTTDRNVNSGLRLVRFSDTGQLLGVLGRINGESADGMAVGPDGIAYVNGNYIGVGTLAGVDVTGMGRGRSFVSLSFSPNDVFYTQPGGMAVGPDGDLYATSNASPFDYPNSKSGLLRFSTSTGQSLGTVFQSVSDVQFNTWDVAFGPDGRAYVATDSGIYRTTPGSTAGERFSTGGGTQIIFGADGDLYALFGGRVRRYDGGTGTLIGTVISGSSFPDLQISSIEFGPTGELLATLFNTNAFAASDSIYRYDIQTGQLLGVFATLPGSRLGLLAAGPVPEPAIGAVVAAAGLLLRRRRSR